MKKLFVIILTFALIGAFICTVSASFTVYDGNLSNTYVEIAKDILPNAKITEDYVFFRSGQYEYILATGKLNYNNNLITSIGNTDIYKINTLSNYNSTYTYTFETVNDFTLSLNERLIYSNLENFPKLENRGDYFEIISTITLCSICVYVVGSSIFKHCLRK